MKPAWMMLSVGVLLGACDCGETPGADGDGVELAEGEGEGNEGEGEVAVCDEQELDLELAGVNVLLMIDGSSSMRSDEKWGGATAAVERMVTDPENAGTKFGLAVFPDPGFLNCGATIPPVIGVGEQNGEAIVSWMRDNQPGIGANTPLVEALETVLRTPDTPLWGEETADFIVLVSDGEDSCFDGEGDFTGADKLNTLAGIVHDLRDLAGITTIPIGFGDSIPAGELAVVAEHGGSTLPSFVQATNGEELTAALTEIARAVRPCRYAIANPDVAADPTKVNFFFDGELVVRDRTNTEGWNWTRAERLEVEFHGQACEDIKSGSVDSVAARFGCPTTVGPDAETCVTDGFFLPFPDVSVLLLQDFSASMNDDDKWTDATTAITRMVADDRNDNVEFGLDLFPDPTGGILGIGGDGCALDAFPDIPTGAYNVFHIIDALSNTDPEGSTPLLAALKGVNQNPGRIGEDGVSGTLLVISDGEESCAEAGVDVIAELGATTRSLVENHGVNVFAIGFGDATSPEELNAIASNGGTALTTYAQADNLDELEQVFDQVARLATSCTFEVPFAGASADYDNVNFFFDGSIVARDTQQADGWNWVNPVTMKEVEFFGEACERLRTGTVEDVSVEFGCPTLDAGDIGG